MAIGDVFQVTDHQTYLGQEIVNVYHYINRREDGNAQTLADAFIADVLPWVTPIQSADLQHTRVSVINLNDEGDFADVVSSIPGNTTEVGDNLPSFYAARLTLIRSTRAVRNGAKRYAGLVEGGVSGNTVDGNILLALQDLATALENPVTGAPTGEWDLIIYGLPTPNRPDPIVADINGVLAEVQVTTQNSRKAWVGN